MWCCVRNGWFVGGHHSLCGIEAVARSGLSDIAWHLLTCTAVGPLILGHSSCSCSCSIPHTLMFICSGLNNSVVDAHNKPSIGVAAQWSGSAHVIGLLWSVE